MSIHPASGADLTRWYSEVQTRFALLRTVLEAAPCMFMPSEIVEAIEQIDHATLQIEGELATINARMAAWNEAVEA